MKAVIQRVTNASVSINNSVYSEINQGLLVFIGIEDADSKEDIEWLCNKIIQLRIFNDANGVMNFSIRDVSGEFLIISQFTLFASTKKGNRPSYSKASKPDIAIPLYELFLKTLKSSVDLPVKTGIFGADMKVSLVNDGPVTILIDTKNKL
jgi:D-tyrosyl-tRNA(Tyr) deacylase